MFAFFCRALCAGLLVAHVAVANEQALAKAPPADDATVALLKGESALSSETSSFDGLTLDGAIRKALDASPRLRSAGATVEASIGERTQAGLWPNPTLDVTGENIGGTDDFSGVRSAQTTVAASQVIEVAGKRGFRRAAAEAGLRSSRFGYGMERLNLIRDVTIAYFDAVAAQERARVAAEQRDLAEDVLKEVGKRVAAARDPLIQRQKAEVTHAMALIAYESAKREATQAGRKLAGLWGASDLPALKADELFAVTEPAMASSEGSERFVNNPSVGQANAEIERASAAFKLEQARAVPDPTLTAGWRDIRGASGAGLGSNDQAFLAGISIPLPVANRNQGAIAQARGNVTKAESDAETLKLQLTTEASRHDQELRIAYLQARSFEREIIPIAEKSYASARQGYGVGKLAFLEVLDAQRVLFDARLQRIDALQRYHAARAELDRLNPWSTIDNTAPEPSHAP